MSRRSQSLQSNSDVDNIIQRIKLRKLSLVLNMKRRRFGKLDLKIVLFLILFIIVIKNTYATSIINQEPNSDDASKDGYSDQNESINEEVEYVRWCQFYCLILLLRQEDVSEFLCLFFL